MKIYRAWIEKREYEGVTWYYIRWRNPDGSKSKPTPSGTSFEAAKSDRDKKTMELRRNPGLPNGEVLIGPAIKLYMAESIKTKDEETPRKIQWALTKFEAFFGSSLSLNSITKEGFIRFRSHLLEKHKVNGLRNIIKFTNAFLSFCQERGDLLVHPGKGALRGKRFQEVKVARFMEEIDIMQIRPFVYMEELWDMFWISLHLGLRRGEIVYLRKQWIDDDCIVLPGELTKSDEPRVLGIEPGVRPVIDKYVRKATDLLFPGWSPERLGQAFKRAVARARKAGVIKGRLRYHDSRHTFASTYLKNGGDISILQKLLGHSNISTTMVYSHFQRTHLKDEMKRIKYNFETPPKLEVVNA